MLAMLTRVTSNVLVGVNSGYCIVRQRLVFALLSDHTMVVIGIIWSS